MLAVYTSLDSRCQGKVEILDLQTTRQWVAWHVIHRGNLLDPPRWTYWIGGHWRFSLGGALNEIHGWGWRAIERASRVGSFAVTPLELVETYGWSTEWVFNYVSETPRGDEGRQP